MFHTVILVGNLGRDPEMRYTKTGQAVCDFSVAVNRTYNAADGTQVKETTWFKVTTWGKTAEVCNQYLSKGRQVLIEGRLNPDENGGPRLWEGRDGKMHAQFEVTASTVRFLGSKGGTNGDDVESEPASTSGGTVDDDSIPF